MKEIQNTNMYVNFDYKQNQKQQQKQVCVLLLGYAGNGKTWMYNKICKKNEKVGFAAESVTSKVVNAQCALLQNTMIMKIYDSPGIVQDSINGVQQIHSILQQIDWNLIVIVCKFDARYAITTLPNIKKFIKLIKTVNQNESLILIMVSHSDMIDIDISKKGQFLSEFDSKLKQNDIPHKVIVFSNILSDFPTLSYLIYFCALQNKKPTTVNVDIKNFEKCLFTSKLTNVVRKEDGTQKPVSFNKNAKYQQYNDRQYDYHRLNDRNDGTPKHLQIQSQKTDKVLTIDRSQQQNCFSTCWSAIRSCVFACWFKS